MATRVHAPIRMLRTILALFCSTLISLATGCGGTVSGGGAVSETDIVSSWRDTFPQGDVDLRYFLTGSRCVGFASPISFGLRVTGTNPGKVQVSVDRIGQSGIPSAAATTLAGVDDSADTLVWTTPPGGPTWWGPHWTPFQLTGKIVDSETATAILATDAVGECDFTTSTINQSHWWKGLPKGSVDLTYHLSSQPSGNCATTTCQFGRCSTNSFTKDTTIRLTGNNPGALTALVGETNGGTSSTVIDADTWRYTSSESSVQGNLIDGVEHDVTLNGANMSLSMTLGDQFTTFSCVLYGQNDQLAWLESQGWRNGLPQGDVKLDFDLSSQHCQTFKCGKDGVCLNSTVNHAGPSVHATLVGHNPADLTPASLQVLINGTPSAVGKNGTWSLFRPLLPSLNSESYEGEVKDGKIQGTYSLSYYDSDLPPSYDHMRTSCQLNLGPPSDPPPGPGDVSIAIDNTCNVSVQPAMINRPLGTALNLTFHNQSIDYDADVSLAGDGIFGRSDGTGGLGKGAAWTYPVSFCVGPNPYSERFDIAIAGTAARGTSACPARSFTINCQ